MDAKTDIKTNIEAGRPSRHVTEGPARAPAALTALEPSGVAAVLKRSCSVADLKPAGRFIAKDLVEGRVNKPKLSGPAHCFGAEEACSEAVTTRQYREGEESVIRDAGPKGGHAAAVLAERLFEDSNIIVPRTRAVAHAGAAAEARSYADI